MKELINSCSNITEPKNGLYITSVDYAQWQDYMSPLIKSYEGCMGDCDKCKASHEDSINKEIRVKDITFVVTEVCDLKCTYCYQTHKTKRVMSKEVAKQAVDFILDEEKINGYYNFKDSPAVILEFIGGEPLLNIDIMNYIVEYFKFKAFEMDHPWATNYMINFSSNGIRFEDDEVQKFLKRNPGKVSIGITIDGNKKLHDACRVFPDGRGSYDIVEKSIKKLVQSYDHPQTKITLAPQNIMYLKDAITNIWKLGLTGAYTNCVFEDVWQIRDATILYRQMKELADYLLENERYRKYFCSLFSETIGVEIHEEQNWCGGNGQMLAIDPEGNCFPCIRFMKYSLNNEKEQPIGDIYKGLDKKEDNEWLNKLKAITMTSQCQNEDNKKCLGCKIASGCSLCVGFDYDTFGDPNHKATFICEMHHARVMANYYYWNKLYKLLNLDKTFELNISEEKALTIITEEEFQELMNLK